MRIYQCFTASVLPAHCPCPVSLIVSTSIIALPKTKECHQFSSLGSCTETLQQTNASCCLTHTHLEEHFIQHTIDFSHKSNPVVLFFFQTFTNLVTQKRNKGFVYDAYATYLKTLLISPIYVFFHFF